MTKQVGAYGAHASLGVMEEMKGAEFQSGVATVPISIVELSVSCRNLVDMDVFSKSDPMCVCYKKQFTSSNWKEVGQTEVIWNNLNPNFVAKFVMDYYFEESQKLKFEVYDVDSKNQIDDLTRHDFLGSMECTLGEVVTSTRLQRPLQGPKKKSGSMILSAEELSSCKDEASLHFCGHKLDKKDVFGKSDPFLLFYRTNEDGSYTVVHKTEAVMKTLNPTWKPFIVPVRALCNGDYDRSLMIECYDYDKDGGHDLIGSFSTNMRELTSMTVTQFECINVKKKAKKGKKYKHSGIIELISCKIEPGFSFLDYIKGGTQVHCTIAIDFTASNGDPQTPQSLHYINPYEPNLYSRALRAVGEIIQDYDSNKMFSALGFGARLLPEFKVSHKFFLNGHPYNSYCQGIEGVMQAYQRKLSSVQLYGPTNFAPCISHVANTAIQNQSGTDYYILLILTDGMITDMRETCDLIVQASALPLSIIIVGIGNADFDSMDILDGDEVRLSSGGTYAERDIVQFVPFRDFIGGKYGHDMTRSQAILAKEVLAEIPEQFLSFMKKHEIKPPQNCIRL